MLYTVINIYIVKISENSSTVYRPAQICGYVKYSVLHTVSTNPRMSNQLHKNALVKQIPA